MVTSKKLHLVSCVILCLFIFFAFGSYEWRYKWLVTETEDLGDGVVRITHLGNEGEEPHEFPTVYETRLNSHGLFEGPHLAYIKGGNDYVQGNYKNGKRHGEFRYYEGGNPPDQLDGEIYDIVEYKDGILQIPTGIPYTYPEWPPEWYRGPGVNTVNAISKLDQSNTTQTSSIEYLRNWLPWFIYDMGQSGIKEELLANFTHEVDAKMLAKAPQTLDQFIDDYYDVLDQVGSQKKYSAVLESYIFLGSAYRTDHLRHFELRLAIFDLYLGRGSNLFKIVEDDYPAFLQALRNKNLTTGTIKGYLNELEGELRKMGPVDLKDALYPFTIEERIEVAANQVDGYDSVKRALRDLMYEMQRENDPLLRVAANAYGDRISDRVTGVTLTASPSGSSSPGQPVTFTAQCTGGVSPHYEFYYRKLPGGMWMRAQSYSAKNTLEAAPYVSGEYEIGVLARSAASKATYEAQTKIKHLFTASPVQSVTLSASPSSPTAPGQQITFTAHATGGINPEYHFFYRTYPSGSWTSAGSYSTRNTFIGAPSVAGDYEIGVLVRSAGSPASWEAQSSIRHTVTWGNEQEESLIFNNWNIYTVHNNPTKPTVFSISSPHIITYIDTYHWNGGQGKTPGTIALRHSDGTLYGPWPAKGVVSSGAPNGEWHVEPNVYIKAGTYTVIDSDPATWSHNNTSNNRGFSRVKGYESF